MRSSLRFTGNLLFIIVLMLVLFSYAMFQGGFVSWFLFYSFLPILLYHLGLLFYPLQNWKVTRTPSRHIARAGDTVEVVLTLERKYPYPLFYGVIEEVMPESLNRKDRKHHNYLFLNEPDKLIIDRSMKKIVPIGFRRTIEIPFSLEELPRGEYQLQSVRVLVGDIFGFVKKEHVFPLVDPLIVEPNEREIKLFESPSSYRQGQTAVNSFQLKNTNVATGVREYAPGDRFSWIHWKQTAKNQAVMTKEFEQERSNSLLLVLDACMPKRRNPLAFEANIGLVLSTIEKLEKTSTEVDLLTIGADTRNFPIKESGHLNGEVRRYLTWVEADGEAPFSRLLKEALWERRRLERLVIFTSSIDDFFRETIQSLRQRHAQVSIIYIQGSELISRNESNLLEQMEKDGIQIQVLTENELITTPVEVRI